MNKKTESLTISLTMEEKQFIKECAESHYLPVSDFIVLSVLACTPNGYSNYDDTGDSPTLLLKKGFFESVNGEAPTTVYTNEKN